jgi:ferric-dicitrate binding protein FerR (iron transport regulator)
VPRRSRFCPHCSAPQPVFADFANESLGSDAEEEEEPPEPPARRRWSATRSFALLVFIAAAIVAFAVLAIALGWLTQDSFGL